MDDLVAEAGKSSDRRTLLELIEKFVAETPKIDDEVADMLKKYPEIIGPGTRDPFQKRYRTNFKLGRLVAIFTLNFLCRAYDRPDLGYVPAGPRPTHN